MKRLTGIGGVFFKCEDLKKMAKWYQKKLTDTRQAEEMMEINGY